MKEQSESLVAAAQMVQQMRWMKGLTGKTKESTCSTGAPDWRTSKRKCLNIYCSAALCASPFFILSFFLNLWFVSKKYGSGAEREILISLQGGGGMALKVEKCGAAYGAAPPAGGGTAGFQTPPRRTGWSSRDTRWRRIKLLGGGFNRSHESARETYLNSPEFVLCKLLLLQPQSIFILSVCR